MRLSLFVADWHVAWSLDFAAVVAVGLYGRAVRRAHGHWPWLRSVSFAAGVACVLVALQSGIGSLDDELLSVHMVQHLLLLMVSPLLLLLGQPMLIALRALPGEPRRRLARGLTRAGAYFRPLPCLAIFTGVVVLTHLPAFYDATLAHPVLHEAEHGLYLGAGLLLWWPILDVDPVRSHRLGGLGRLVYVLASMVPMAVLGAYLDRDPSLFYTPYGPPAHALGISAVADQQHAGAIMWVAGSVIMTLVGLGAVMSALIAEERRQRRSDARAMSSPGSAIG